MHKRIIAAITVAALGGAGMVIAPGATAASGPGGSTCSLSGTANFNTPLYGGPSAGSFTYSFTGKLTSCQSSSSGAPSSGTIAAGVGGLPLPSGSGSCASSSTSGIAVIDWSDGKNTVVSYSTTGATAAVSLQGTVIDHVTYQSGTDPTTGQPVYTTVTTNEPATPVGASAGGALAFQPPDPTACAPNGAGVKTAGISGQIGTGTS